MPKGRLTRTRIDSLQTDLVGGQRWFDTKYHGLGIKIHPTGRRTWFVSWGPSTRRRTLMVGTYPATDPEAAWVRAQEVLRDVEAGIDPSRKRKTDLHTFGEWIDAYLEESRARKKRPELDELYLNDAKNRWAEWQISEIKRDDVKGALKSVVDRAKAKHLDRIQAARKANNDDRVAKLEGIPFPGHTTGNRWLASVRACLEEARRSGHIKENPAMTVKQYRRNPPRRRVLSEEEMQLLLSAIAQEEDQHIAAGFRLLLETGARTSEVLQARWEDIDLDAAEWTIPSPKAGYPQVQPLASQTVAMLRKLDRNGPYVIPGRRPDTRRQDLRGPWMRLRLAAEIPADITLHDLRRTFGLHAARTAGLHIASKLLRHGDVRITEQVYAPLGIDELREGLERLQRPADVVSIKSHS
jgi:integrase